MVPADSTPFRRALIGGVVTLGLVLGTSACTGDDEPSEGPSASAPAQATDDGTTFQIETRTTLGRVVGRLAPEQRRRLPEVITEVVQGWFNAAYVGGEWPRTDFKDAYPGFTRRAADEARKDRTLMSNDGIGARIDEVTPTRSRVWLDVLAVRRAAVGVTARFELQFRTEGELTREVTVRGRLLLNRQDGQWRVFAYDVARGGRA